jgi:hypothetical protein
VKYDEIRYIIILLMKVLLTLLILGLCLADEAEPTGGLKIDISMTQNEDDYGKCDLDIEINN